MNLREFLILKQRVKEEQANQIRLLTTLQERGYLSVTKPTPAWEDEFLLRALASVLLDYYTATENIFKEIAKKVDGVLPKGEEWHKDLLQQMKLSLPGVRPEVISAATFTKLDEYRKFRHLVRNVYGFNLVPERFLPLVESLQEVNAALDSDVQRFINAMEELLRLED